MSQRLGYCIAMYSLLCGKFIIRIPGMEWSCNTDGGSALILSLFRQDYRIPEYAKQLVIIVIAAK